MQHGTGGPLRGVAHLAGRPSRRRVVHADRVPVRILAAHEGAQVLPELQAEPAVVVHVVFAADVPDHVVGGQAVDHIACPPAHLLGARALVEIVGAPPRHDPQGDPLAVGVGDESLGVVDGIQVRRGEVSARQSRRIVRSEHHLADRETPCGPIVDHLLGARERDSALQPRPPGIPDPQEGRSVRVFEVPAGARAAARDSHEPVAHGVFGLFADAPCGALETALDPLEARVGGRRGVGPLAGRRRSEAGLPGLAAVPKARHGVAQPLGVAVCPGKRDHDEGLTAVRQTVHVRIGELGAAGHGDFEWLPWPGLWGLSGCRKNADPDAE